LITYILYPISKGLLRIYLY